MRLTCLNLLTVAMVMMTSFLVAARPTQGDGMVVYWGQNSAGAANPSDRDKWEKPLRHYCENSTYDIINIGFLHIFFDSRDPQRLPGLNFAFHCETTFPDHPFLLYCPEIGADIAYCQSKGVEVVLSLGGAAGSYGFTSANDARLFAKNVWEMFLGGNSSLPRPFGPGVVLNGVDLDIEGGSNLYYGTFINEIRSYFNLDPSRHYVVSAAPQCPFPDYYMGPDPVNDPNSRALSAGPFDLITIQFYNNYCGLTNYNNPNAFNFDAWSAWGFTSYNPNIQIYLGAPASPQAAGSGYVDIVTLKNIAADLRSKYSNFGGVMIWEASLAELNNNYGKQISDFLKN